MTLVVPDVVKEAMPPTTTIGGETERMWIVHAVHALETVGLLRHGEHLRRDFGRAGTRDACAAPGITSAWRHGPEG